MDETERFTRHFKWRSGTCKDHNTCLDLKQTGNRTEMSCKVSSTSLVHDFWGEFCSFIVKIENKTKQYSSLKPGSISAKLLICCKLVIKRSLSKLSLKKMLKRGCTCIVIMNFDTLVSLETMCISQGGPMMSICVPVLYFLVTSLFLHMQKSYLLSSDSGLPTSSTHWHSPQKTPLSPLPQQRDITRIFPHVHISIHSPQCERC